MILRVSGDISTYYVQTLCLLFFPGSKFGTEEKSCPENPEADVTFRQDGDTFHATAALRYQGKSVSAVGDITRAEYPGASGERLAKIAVGRALFAAGKELLGYTPPWGILTGVRPSKVASELIMTGNGILRSKRVLRDEYFVNPKKAALAVSVAATELKLTKSILPDKTCSVYISIPFCPSRCAYCSFVSGTSGRLLSLIDDYLVMLLRDIENIFSVIRSLGLHVVTVYIGGGTPTVLSAAQLHRLLSCVGQNADIDALHEFTLEAGRPDTITAEKLTIARESGVTRISVNPQTLSDELLRNIGRQHTVADFYRAYEMAQNSGIRDINVDLIAGLPGDNFNNFSDSCDAVLSLAPSNLTVHSFAVKNAADFRQRGDFSFSLSCGDAAKSVEYSQLRAKNAGYRPYYMYRQKNTVGNLENVGYAQEGHEGLYNILMMEELHSIFAAGAAAVTKLVYRSAPAAGNPVIRRIFTPKYPYEYLRDAEKIRIGDVTAGVPSIAEKIGEFYRENA